MIKSELLYVLMLSILCVGCSSDTRNATEPSDSGEDYPTVLSYDNKDYTLPPQSPLPIAETVDREMSEEVLKVASSTISKWYQAGYDQGYEDGEDDALSRNGYEGQYDDDCRYKGKKRKEYEDGYAEGYEAGYYDNVADDGSDDEYE